jgi:tRNA A37 threonylcarbamoyladenosine dehydratase
LLCNNKATSTDINNTVMNVIVPLIENMLGKALLIEHFFESTDKRVSIVALKTNKKPHEVEIKDIYFTNDNAGRTIRPALKLENKIMRIEFSIHLRKFKTQEKKFDVRCTLFIKFDDYEYSMSNQDNDLEITKSYGEALTHNETNLIIRTLIRDIKKIMQERIK